MFSENEHITLLHHVQDEHFAQYDLATCTLSIFMDKGMVAFYISTPTKEKKPLVIYLKAYQIKELANFFIYKLLIRDILEQEADLQTSFHRVIVGLNTSKNILIPNIFFSKNKIAAYYKFNNSIESDVSIKADELPYPPAYNVYALDEYIYDTLFDKFHLFDYKHATSFSLPHLFDNELVVQGKKVLYIDIQVNKLMVGCWQQKQLLLFNTYSCATKEDYLYHITNVGKQLHFQFFDTQRHVCLLAGNITETDSLYSFLHIYIVNLQFISRPSHLSYCSNLLQLPTQFYYNLYTIS